MVLRAVPVVMPLFPTPRGRIALRLTGCRSLVVICLRAIAVDLRVPDIEVSLAVAKVCLPLPQRFMSYVLTFFEVREHQ
jgi:hypothetical protein